MGQAKTKLEAMRTRQLELAAYWDFPPTPEEAAICAGLRDMEIVIAQRASPADLSYMRMPKNSCHENVSWYERNDPTGQSRAVTGWWVQWPDFVLHSVLKFGEKYICITPSDMNEQEFPFMPDPEIIWERRQEHYIAKKMGYEIGIGVRLFPEFTMARLRMVQERLRSGAHPIEAIKFSDTEMRELKLKYIDIELAKLWNPGIE